MADVIAIRCLTLAAVFALCVAAPAPAADAPKPKTTRTAPARANSGGGAAPDFAPGTWTDGVERHVSDYKGKVLLIFSFDPKYVDSPADVRKKLQAYDVFIRDKPVAVVGVVTGARDVTMSRSLIKPVDVNAPMFFDNIGQMPRSYAAGSYSVYVRMVDAEGNLNSSYTVTPAEVDAALKNVNWKYRDNGYHNSLNTIVELFEWNQSEAG